jgi:ankyrin repeat protein
MAELLLESGASVKRSVHPNRLLDIAEVVELLLDAGAKVNAKDGNGRTALDYADPKSSEAAKVLRAHGGKTTKSPRRL